MPSLGHSCCCYPPGTADLPSTVSIPSVWPCPVLAFSVYFDPFTPQLHKNATHQIRAKFIGCWCPLFQSPVFRPTPNAPTHVIFVRLQDSGVASIQQNFAQLFILQKFLSRQILQHAWSPFLPFLILSQAAFNAARQPFVLARMCRATQVQMMQL